MMEQLKDKSIFIVEDDPANMAVYAVVLKRHGARVIQDHWNAGTIDMIHRFMPVDVILMDLMLRRGTSGYDIIDQLDAQPELADIPVVIVSASDPAVEIPHAQEKGCAGFISKPINMNLFPQQIASCLNGDPVWDTGQ